MAWSRHNFGSSEAFAIDMIRQDTAIPIAIVQQGVSDDFELALQDGIMADLPDATISFLGAATTGSSSLLTLQIMLHPVLGTKGHSALQRALQRFESYPAAKSRGQLLD